MQEYEPNDEFISLLIGKEGIQGVLVWEKVLICRCRILNNISTIVGSCRHIVRDRQKNSMFLTVVVIQVRPTNNLILSTYLE